MHAVRASCRTASTCTAATRAAAHTTEAMGQALRQVAFFPKTSSIKDAALTTLAYDGSKASFVRLREEAAQLLELRAADMSAAVDELLVVLERDFSELYLASVDCIAVHRIGQHVLRVDNSAGTSGRALVVELHDLRQKTIMIVEQAKARTFRRVAASIAVVTVVASFLCAERSKAELDEQREALRRDLKKLLARTPA